MVSEARKNGMLGAEEAANLTGVPSLPQKGIRLGNWLTREQARELLAVPDRSTLKGKRDYLILAILVGCALRREDWPGSMSILSSCGKGAGCAP
jgi:integrase